MLATGPSSTAGLEVPNDLAEHGARSASRRLVAGLFDAWDDGDEVLFAAHFADGGSWKDPSGSEVSGPELVTRLAQWRAWEPWSIHWLSNESVTVCGDDLEGSWLWSAASTVDGGSVAMWSGGDLRLSASFASRRWQITRLEMSDRYRSPYSRGWLEAPLTPVELPAPSLRTPNAERSPSIPSYSQLPADSGVAAEAAVLRAETDLRNHLWSFTAHQENGSAGELIAAHWVEEGSLTLRQGTSSTIVDGRPRISLAFANEHLDLSVVMQMLFSIAIEVEWQRATCRWRDLWVATRGETAMWISHRYEANAVRHGEQWRFQNMVRDRVLECRYSEGWSTTSDNPTVDR
jgi:hypothetical protein